MFLRNRAICNVFDLNFCETPGNAKFRNIYYWTWYCFPRPTAVQLGVTCRVNRTWKSEDILCRRLEKGSSIPWQTQDFVCFPKVNCGSSIHLTYLKILLDNLPLVWWVKLAERFYIEPDKWGFCGEVVPELRFTSKWSIGPVTSEGPTPKEEKSPHMIANSHVFHVICACIQQDPDIAEKISNDVHLVFFFFVVLYYSPSLEE